MGQRRVSGAQVGEAQRRKVHAITFRANASTKGRVIREAGRAPACCSCRELLLLIC